MLQSRDLEEDKMIPPPSFTPPASPDRTLRPPNPWPRTRGERRNFDEEAFRIPHKFPIGSKVWMFSPQMRCFIGPLFVAELSESLHPRGPPQYILQPAIGPNQDASKWAMCNERMLVECDSDQPPIIPPFGGQ